MAVEFHQGQQGNRMAYVEKEMPESGVVSLVCLLMFLCISYLFQKPSLKRQLRFYGRRNVNCPASGAKWELAKQINANRMQS